MEQFQSYQTEHLTLKFSPITRNKTTKKRVLQWFVLRYFTPPPVQQIFLDNGITCGYQPRHIFRGATLQRRSKGAPSRKGIHRMRAEASKQTKVGAKRLQGTSRKAYTRARPPRVLQISMKGGKKNYARKYLWSGLPTSPSNFSGSKKSGNFMKKFLVASLPGPVENKRKTLQTNQNNKKIFWGRLRPQSINENATF